MQPGSPSRTRFEDLVTEFNDVDGVTPPRGGAGFGRLDGRERLRAADTSVNDRNAAGPEGRRVATLR